MIITANSFVKAIILGAFLTLLASGSKAQDHDDHADHSTNPDQRQALIMNAKQRHHVLTEMRQLLATTQGVVEGLAEDDMEKVAQAAALSAPQAPKTVDFRMKDVLPPDFLQMGKAAHVAFGDMEQKAKNGATKEEITRDLADTLNICTTCHSTFQVVLED